MTTDKDESKRIMGVIFQNSMSTLENLNKITLFYFIFITIFGKYKVTKWIPMVQKAEKYENTKISFQSFR